MNLDEVELPAGALYYLCGPLPFMIAIRTALLDWDVPAIDIQYEVFGPDLWQADAETEPVPAPARTAASDRTDSPAPLRQPASLLQHAPDQPMLAVRVFGDPSEMILNGVDRYLVPTGRSWVIEHEVGEDRDACAGVQVCGAAHRLVAEDLPR